VNGVTLTVVKLIV